MVRALEGLPARPGGSQQRCIGGCKGTQSFHVGRGASASNTPSKVRSIYMYIYIYVYKSTYTANHTERCFFDMTQL